MSGQGLDESKFLSEQINSEEEPTEEEVIEKAEELGISDLGLAREALTKELDAQWKPYLNRRGEVYYINLEDRKAYQDHPVDMEIAITDALRHSKKLPAFREFAIEDVSRSPRLIQQEISRYHREKGLNVVYEESDEESLRRDTAQSVEEAGQSELLEPDRGELDLFRMEQEREMRAELAAYRAAREGEYAQRVRLSREVVEEARRARLARLAAEAEQEVTARNDISFQRSTQASREELLAKRDRLDDLHGRELQLAYRLSGSQQLKEEEVRVFYRTKRCHQKQKLVQKTHADIRNSLFLEARREAEQASREFSAELAKIINAKINLRERLFENIEKLTNQPSKSGQTKRRYSIFNPDLFIPEKRESAASSFQSLTDSLQISERIHEQPVLPAFSLPPRLGPSLFLRLSLRIL